MTGWITLLLQSARNAMFYIESIEIASFVKLKLDYLCVCGGERVWEGELRLSLISKFGVELKQL